MRNIGSGRQKYDEIGVTMMIFNIYTGRKHHLPIPSEHHLKKKHSKTDRLNTTDVPKFLYIRVSQNRPGADLGGVAYQNLYLFLKSYTYIYTCYTYIII